MFHSNYVMTQKRPNWPALWIKQVQIFHTAYTVCCETFNDGFITNSLLHLTVKDYEKFENQSAVGEVTDKANLSLY